MSNDPVAKIDNAEAWNDFCDLLKKGGDVILRNDLELSTFDRAEGMRYLGRLLRAGLFSFSERTGPEYPKFRPMPELVKMGLDNPDNYYVSTGVNPRYRYRIRGNRRSIHYMSFAATNQNFAAKDKITGGAGHLNDAEIETDADGNFEIIASQTEEPGNWLRMAGDTKQILLRQTFLHKDREAPVDIEVECIDHAGAPPPLDPTHVASSLMGSAMYAIGCAQWFADWVRDFESKASVNTFHLPTEEEHRFVGGDPNVRIWLGRWKLEPDEALVIEMTPPNCHYWNFQLANIWAESLDYDFRQVHINSGGAALRADGSVQLVVANEDPGTENWMDTAGHHHGTMCVRWVRADSHPEPRCRVVKLADL